MFDVSCPDWFEDAPCVGKDRLFFSAHPSNRRMAVAICNDECPNTEKCLEYAVSNNLSIGVWGGKTGPELIRILIAG